MGNLRARAFVVAGLTCFGVACSSAPSDPPPLVSNYTTDDATVTLPADDVAKAAGVYSWTATLRQTDEVLPGAVDVDDMPADSGRVTIEIFGLGPTHAPVLVGRFALATAMALALPDDAGHAALEAVVSGTFLAHASSDGSRAADLDDVTELTLFRSFAGTLAAWTPTADGAKPAALNAYLHIDSPTGGGTGSNAPTTSCPSTDAELKAIQQKSLQSLGTLVHALLENANAMCNPLSSDKPPLLATQRPDLFGVNGMLSADDLQKAGVHHMRGTFAHGAWGAACNGTTFSSFKTQPQNLQAELDKFNCVFDGLKKQMTQYKGLKYPDGMTDYPVDVTMLIPHLDGFETVRDTTGSVPYPPPKGQNVTYTANDAWNAYAGDWKQYACAAIKAGTGADPQVKTFELWNEPDDAGNAPIPATLLAPMLVDLIKTVRNGDCTAMGFDTSTIQFSIGAASVGYYNQILAVPGDGPTLLSDLAFYNLHPYHNWPDETQGNMQSGGVMADSNEFGANGQSLADTLRDLQTKIMSVAGFKPIVFSEWGYDHGMPACEGRSQTSCTCAWTDVPDDGSGVVNTCGANSATISCPDLDAKVASGACTKKPNVQLPAYCNAGCVLTHDQCAGEVSDIEAFYKFFSNPPSDVAPLANAVRSADLYGFPRLECDGADRNALKNQADRSKTDTNTSCTDDKLRQLILDLRKTQTMADFLCCKKSIKSWAGFASTVVPPGDGKCDCFDSTNGARPFKKGNECVACPVGPSVDSIAGCLSAAVIVKDSCTMPTVRDPGWYCSELDDGSAFHCTAEHTISLGAQCPVSGQKCTGGPGGHATANDDGSGLVCGAGSGTGSGT